MEAPKFDLPYLELTPKSIDTIKPPEPKPTFGSRIKTLFNQNKMNLRDKLTSPVSGNIRLGKDQATGLVPIILAIGLGLFALLSFGGLFSKK